MSQAGSGTDESTLVAGVFSDHAAAGPAVAKLKGMGAELAQSGVSGVLTVAKRADGTIDAQAVALAGVEATADALVERTRAALETLSGVQASGDTPAELGAALAPGAVAVGVFLPADRAQVVTVGLQNLGAQVLTDDELRRIGARLGGAPINGTLDSGDTGTNASVHPAAKVFDWQAEYAYTLGLQAFIYGFPYVYGAQCRYKWTNQPRDPEHVPYSAVGRFWHAPGVLDASYQDGGCPNNDTLYSVSWVDLSSEPVILSHPDMGDRYFSFQLAAMTSDNFDYVGQRTTGSKAGSFAIVGPGWTGELPDGVTGLAPSPTPWMLCLGRTLVDGDDDVPTVQALQEQYRLTPMSLWGAPDAEVPERRDVLKPVEMAEDPLGPWKTLNAILAENPPPAHHGILLRQFAGIGVGPGLDPDAQPKVVRESLVRAAGTGMQLLKQQFLSGQWATMVNGWRYPPPSEGRAGDDFLLRAADQSLAGIVANDPAEAVYLVNMADADGNPFSGSSRYELHFTGTDLPPVDSFWSLTMYKADMNLVPNPAGRYSIGDRTPGLAREPDGGLTIRLQTESPGSAAEANWLPCPADGTWFVILRLYRPHEDVIAADWKCPPIRKVG
jgi:hypothetical protein